MFIKWILCWKKNPEEASKYFKLGIERGFVISMQVTTSFLNFKEYQLYLGEGIILLVVLNQNFLKNNNNH